MRKSGKIHTDRMIRLAPLDTSTINPFKTGGRENDLLLSLISWIYFTINTSKGIHNLSIKVLQKNKWLQLVLKVAYQLSPVLLKMSLQQCSFKILETHSSLATFAKTKRFENIT